MTVDTILLIATYLFCPWNLFFLRNTPSPPSPLLFYRNLCFTNSNTVLIDENSPMS